MKEFLGRQAHESEYDVKILGHYKDFEASIVGGFFYIENLNLRLVLTNATPVVREINGKKLTINFKAMVNYDVKPFSVNGNTQAKFEISGLKDISILDINVKNLDNIDFYYDDIKESIKDMLSEYSDIEIDYKLTKGPFDNLL